jgi:hypothetical protein
MSSARRFPCLGALASDGSGYKALAVGGRTSVIEVYFPQANMTGVFTFSQLRTSLLSGQW